MWQIIEANKRKSWLLFFALGVILLLCGYIFGLYFDETSGGTGGLITAGIIWLSLSLLAYYQGDKMLLMVAGAKKVEANNYPQLNNIVEEIKISANLPALPEIYLIEDQSLNAFATGIKPEKSAIALTTGLLNQLNRDEIQGVVAHEVGHIINRDVLFMTLAGVMIGSISLLADMFYRHHWWQGQGKKSKNDKGADIIAIIAIFLAIFAPLFAQILYFATSKKREYLADAEAVRLTRNPLGLALALEKISQNPGSRKNTSQVVAPIYIANPLAHLQNNSLFATHPPIEQRIQILRSLANATNYHAYEQAYLQTTGSQKSIMPQNN